MRKIEFRAWDKKGKEMFKVVMVSFLGKQEIILTGRGGSTDNKDAILMQYTGLKDKNGKEIYEGDIFNFHSSKEWKGTNPDNPCVVFWSDELAAFMFYIGKREMSTLLPPSESMEIIGNIYENPELLEGK